MFLKTVEIKLNYFKLICEFKTLNRNTHLSDRLPDYIFHVKTMLNSGPYTILNNDPTTNHLVELKRHVKNSVLLSD